MHACNMHEVLFAKDHMVKFKQWMRGDKLTPCLCMTSGLVLAVRIVDRGSKVY